MALKFLQRISILLAMVIIIFIVSADAVEPCTDPGATYCSGGKHCVCSETHPGVCACSPCKGNGQSCGKDNDKVCYCYGSTPPICDCLASTDIRIGSSNFQ